MGINISCVYDMYELYELLMEVDFCVGDEILPLGQVHLEHLVRCHKVGFQKIPT